MDRFDRRIAASGEAEIQFLDGDFRVLRPGAYVRCAASGVHIPIDELRYWDVDLQEAYASPQAKLDRLGVKVALAADPQDSAGNEN